MGILLNRKRTEIIIDQIICITIYISSKHDEDCPHIKQMNIIVDIVYQELLCWGSNGTESRKEDIYDRIEGYYQLDRKKFHSTECIYCVW